MVHCWYCDQLAAWIKAKLGEQLAAKAAYVCPFQVRNLLLAK